MADEIECDACGGRHEVMESLPGRLLDANELTALETTDRVLYAGPTSMEHDPEQSALLTPMAVVQTRKRTVIASFHEDEGVWCITEETDTPDDNPRKFAALVNEMATHCVEDGHLCVKAWCAENENGSFVPGMGVEGDSTAHAEE